ncbi:ABC-2 transporter permease [Bacillus sp. FJAT-49732]|uniref:ABC-2 transporter permease n=1 Tax=Lederbergia citrisecunda TaxID=2833583 RepID=A0A942THV3_9BACI|nr:ABC-2 transporter permease [Lederbergia citrisecunda]MBS4198315.1 ABC-2 transporter permease [Lederbergia citrisecunda]
MVNLIKADLKSIKLLEYMILIPFVFILALLVNPGFTNPYYMWIFYFTLALSSILIDRKRQDQVLPVMMGLPIKRKEYIAAKYLFTIVCFFISTIGMTIIALMLDWKMEFFNFNHLITAFLLLLLFMAIFLPLGLFFKPASFFITFILIFFITIRESSGAPWIQFHPTLLLSIILYYVSYLLSVRIFERRNI